MSTESPNTPVGFEKVVSILTPLVERVEAWNEKATVWLPVSFSLLFVLTLLDFFMFVVLGIPYRLLVGRWPAGTYTEPKDVEVTERIENGQRCFDWFWFPLSWESVESGIDRFLTACVDAAEAASAGKPIEWLVLEYDAEQGTMTAVPASAIPAEDDEESYELTEPFSFRSSFLEIECMGSRDVEAHLLRVWRLVSRGLLQGEASRRLAEARKTHPLRIAGFDYWEGMERGENRLSESGGLVSTTSA